MAAPVVTYTSTSGPLTAPTLFINFDQDLDLSKIPLPAAFSVALNGVVKTVTGVTMGENNFLFLDIAEPLPPYYNAADVVTVAYTDPGTSASIQNMAGEHAASFGARTADNGVDHGDLSYVVHIYEGAAGTIELPSQLGGQYETTQSMVRVVVQRGTIPLSGMHAWLYVDGVAHTDVWGAIAAATYGDTATVSVTGLAAGAHTFDIRTIGADDVFYSAGSYFWFVSQGQAIQWPIRVTQNDAGDGQFLLENFTDANGTAVIGHAGEVGATWALSTQSTVSNGGSTNAASLYQGAAYRASTTVGAVNGYIYPSGNPSTVDFAYEIDVRVANSTISFTPGNTCIEAYFCLDNTLNSFYFFRFGYASSGGSVLLQLFERIRIEGTATVFNVTAPDVLVPHGATHTLRLEVTEAAGWSVTMNGTPVDSGSDYITPQAAQNMLLKLQSSTAASGNHHILIDAVRGYDTITTENGPFLVDGATGTIGEPTLVFVLDSAVGRIGQPGVPLPAMRVTRGARGRIGKPTTTYDKTVHPRSARGRIGLPVLIKFKP